MIGYLPGEIDLSDPVEREHPLNAGLVSWWLPLQHNSGSSTVYDLCNRNELGYSGGRWGASDRGTGSLELNGTTEYAFASKGITTAWPWTLSCWFRCNTGGSGYRDPMAYGSTASATQYSLIQVADTTGYSGIAHHSLFANSTNTATVRITKTQVAVNDGKWHHAAVVCGQTYQRIYLDGVGYETSTTNVNAPSVNYFTLGCLRNGASPIQFFPGGVTDARVDASLLSDDAIFRLYESGLRGHPDLIRRVPTSRWFIGATAGAVYTLTAEASAYTISAQNAGVLRGRRVSAEASAYTISAQNAGVLRGRRVPADAAAYTTTAQDVSFPRTRVLTSSAAVYTVSAQDAGVLRSRIVGADSAAYTTAAQSAGVLRGRRVPADSAAYTTAAQSAGVLRGRRVPADASTINLDAQDADLSLSAQRSINAVAASYAVAGQAVGLIVGRRVGADVSAFSTTAQSAGVLYGRRVSADASTVNIAAQDASFPRTRVLACTAGTYALAGTAALTLARLLPSAAASYAISAQSAGVYQGRAMTSTAGGYAIAAQDAGLTPTRRLTSSPAAYVIAGDEVSLIDSGNPDGGYEPHISKIPLRG